MAEVMDDTVYKQDDVLWIDVRMSWYDDGTRQVADNIISNSKHSRINDVRMLHEHRLQLRWRHLHVGLSLDSDNFTEFSRRENFNDNFNGNFLNLSHILTSAVSDDRDGCLR